MKQIQFLFFFLVFMLCSCDENANDNDFEPNYNYADAIEEAKSAFTATYATHKTKVNASLSRYGARFSSINWDKAVEKNISLGKAVVVPVVFEENLYMSFGSSKCRNAINGSTFLYMYKDRDQRMHTEVVQYVAEDNSADNYKKPFLGLVVIEDLEGKFLAAYHFGPDKNTPLSRSTSISQNSKNATARVASGWCETTTYYTCPEVGSYPEDCTQVGQDTYCYEYGNNYQLTMDMDYAQGGGGDGDINNGGSSGYALPPSAVFVAQIDDSKLAPCMQPIMSDVKKLSQGVGQIITKFAGNTPGFNWEVKDGVINKPYTNAFTDSNYDRLNGIVTTTFDSNKFFNSSNLSVARTIIHESVHAYLVAYFSTDPLSAYKTYAQLVQDWNSQKRPDLNSIQHDEMVRSFVNDIALALQEYGQLNNYNLPAQFYQDLAWGGLEGTSAFKNLSSSDRNRISYTILIEMSGKDAAGQNQTPKGQPSGC